MKTVGISNGGFAIVYGLAIFILASMSGVSIMYLSQKDQVTASDYSKMRSAAQGARAALEAFEGQCKSQPQHILEILRKYNANQSDKWLLGDPLHANSEKKIKCWNSPDAPSYSACVMRFDSVNLLIQVQGIGYGMYGGKKRAIGIYKLRGAENVVKWDQKDAIHLAGTARDFNKPVTVQGDVYFGADVHFNGGASGSVIDGNLKTGNIPGRISSFDGNTKINGDVFFQTPVTINSSALVEIFGKSGFAQNIRVDKDFDLHGDAFFNGIVDGNARLNMHNNIVTGHSGQVTWADIVPSTASQLNDRSNAIDIAYELNMNAGNELSFSADVNSIESDKIFQYSSLKTSDPNWGNFSADELNDLYTDAASNEKLWNDFLVIRVNSPASMKSTASTFNGKVIFIVDATLSCNSNWYNCGNSSNTMIWVRSGGELNGMGSGKNFRGYIYVEGTGKVIYDWRVGNTFQGAIHHVSAQSGFQLNSGEALDIQYDESVLKEFVVMKLVNPPGIVSAGVCLNDVRLRPEMLSISY